MKLTAVKSGAFVVSVDGVDVSTHTTEREAVESATNRAEQNATAVVQYRHDYVVKVEATKQRGAALLGSPVALASGSLRFQQMKAAAVSGQAIRMNEGA